MNRYHVICEDLTVLILWSDSLKSLVHHLNVMGYRAIAITQLNIPSM